MTSLTIAFLAGLAVGFVDLHASAVQAPLLLLMLSAFVVATFSRTRALRIALAVTAGMFVTHVVASMTHGGVGAQWGMLVAILPTYLAALGGKGVAVLLASTSSTLSQSPLAAPDARPWWQRPSPTVRLLASALLGCALVGAVPVYATSVARGQPFAWWVTTWWQIVTFLAWTLAAPLVVNTWKELRRADLGVTPRELVAHAGIVAMLAAAHALVLPFLTIVLRVPLGAGGFEGAIPWALAAYLPLDALTYVLIVGLAHASDVDRLARAALARETAIKGELSVARLASLRAQLQPHFLFNALNAATVLIRRGDAESGQGVLGALSELLRYVLRGADDENGASATGPELVRLDDEIAFAESYLAIERQRFPDRLRTSTDVPAGARIARVPHLLLQPLVENAVKHGVGDRRGIGIVALRAWRDGRLLHIVVEDDGPGLSANIAETGGIGVANTRSRLAAMYGADASLSLESREGGGAAAHVVLPWVE